MGKEFDGGPAFPQPIAAGHAGDLYVAWRDVPDAEGMTLRDYFACSAPGDKVDFDNPEELRKFIGAEKKPQTIDEWAEYAARARAKLAYIYADAMLEARK